MEKRLKLLKEGISSAQDICLQSNGPPFCKNCGIDFEKELRQLRQDNLLPSDKGVDGGKV